MQLGDEKICKRRRFRRIDRYHGRIRRNDATPIRTDGHSKLLRLKVLKIFEWHNIHVTIQLITRFDCFHIFLWRSNNYSLRIYHAPFRPLFRESSLQTSLADYSLFEMLEMFLVLSSCCLWRFRALFAFHNHF
ncbi:hypothetical protein T10_11052 [Trichinella papuae]|uniref:Uncharacterized protein n=1 Tax=Trichinella papuae TaxID=268474 RepID=A0A0V1N4C6_9BILA|nr:hypothetical protein T10_11052 [Trichinella papuae]